MANETPLHAVQKEFIDLFFSKKEEIGKLQRDGSVVLNPEEVQLITEIFSFKSAELLKTKLQSVKDSELTEKGISRKRKNIYSLSATISYIVSQKFQSNMTASPEYTPSLAEQLSLISHVSSDLYKRSLVSANEEDKE